MAAITSYSALKLAVQQWLNRTDQSATDAIPLCISFAEQDFNRTVRLPSMERLYTRTASASNPDWIGKVIIDPLWDLYEIKHFTLNGVPLNRVSVEVFNRIKNGDVVTSATTGPNNTPTVSTLQGSTSNSGYFTRVEDELHTIPEIVDGDEVELIYFQDFQEMSADGDFPESLRVAPDVMLYLSLRHASLFLRDDEQAQFWEQKAADAASRLITRLDEIEWSGSSIIVPAFRS